MVSFNQLQFILTIMDSHIIESSGNKHAEELWNLEKKDMLNIGKVAIKKLDREYEKEGGTIWIVSSSGEAGNFDENDVQDALDSFFKKHF